MSERWPSIEFRSTMVVKYVDHMGSDQRVIEAMLVSTDTVKAAQDMQKMPGRINWLVRDRHGSPFEHTALTLYVEAPIFVFREWHRHRIGFSYNEMSGRYSVLPGLFYFPDDQRNLRQVGKPGSYTYEPGTYSQKRSLEGTIRLSSRRAWGSYNTLLDQGIAKEVARMVLPVNIFSKMFVTLNARSAMAFLSLRTKDEASHFPSFPQREIEMCAEMVEAIFKEHWPLTHAAFVTNGRVCP